MKKKSIVISSLSLSTVLALGGLVAITTTKLGADLKAEPGELNDYMLQFNGENNIFEGDGTHQAALSDPTNKVSVTVSGYSQEVNAWGKLANGGYLLLNNRVGGLMSVNYAISNDLVLEFGYYEYDKPTYYRADLPTSLQNFSFPEDKGYPDVFKLSNEGENPVTVWGFNVYYNCSQIDLHVHDISVQRKMVNNVPVYYKVCNICEEEEVIDLSGYSIKVDNVEYTPYTYMDYNGIGELDFDYQNVDKNRFILSIDGAHDSTNLRVDTNTDSKSSIIIRSSNNASLHEFKFRGGYGALIFEGEELKFVNGTLDTEAIYTTVRSPLTFVNADDTYENGIYINNGQLVLEGGSDVNINGYKHGILFNQNATGTGGLNQSGGTLTIENCETGIKTLNKYLTEAVIKGTISINDCKVGIEDININIGSDSDSKEGKLYIKVDASKAGTSGDYWADRAVGIKFNYSDRKLNLHNGKMFIYCNPTDRGNNKASAVGVTSGGFVNGILTVSNSFKYGFAQIQNGFDGHSTAVYNNDYSNTNENTFYYYDVEDRASYCGSKPTGTKLNSFAEFEALF